MHTYREDEGWTSPTWPETAVGDVTRWHYEQATGLLMSKEDAAGKAVTYTYGPAGRLATRTWARQKPGGGPLRTTYGYDEATGELKTVDYNDDTPDVSYTYDRLGRQKTVTDGTGSRAFAYDPQSLQLQTETMEGLTPAVLTRYYDPVGVKGRPLGLTLGSNYVVGYGYDVTGRMQSVSWTANGSSDVATYSRVPASDLLAGYSSQTGFGVTYGYEAKRDLKTRVRNSFGGTAISRYDYRYDTIRRRSSVETSGSAFGPTRFTSWGYDDRNQVTGSNRYAGTFTETPNAVDEVAAERRDYDYDPIGNRETALDQDGVTSISYTSNELNQYLSVGNTAATYREDGNLLNDGTKTLRYNAENQLKSVTVPGVSASTYDFDYLGRRVRKTVDVLDESGRDHVVTWVYSGWNKIEERSTAVGSTSMRNFVRGLDLLQSMNAGAGVGGLLAVVDGIDGASVFTHDGNGNVSELIDASISSVTAHYEYDTFGNTILAAGTAVADNAYRFSAKYADDETGLVYCGYRYYHAGVGSWTQRDPIGAEGGMNPYGFVGNRGTDLFDPLGLYQEAGHFYTVYYVASAQGYSPDESFEFAYYAQLGDEAAALEAITAGRTLHRDIGRIAIEIYLQGSRVSVAREEFALEVQRWLHSLHGGGVQAVEKRRQCLARMLKDRALRPWERGLVAHALGDAFAHTVVQGRSQTRRAYAPPLGHAWQGSDPDSIANDLPLYDEYVGVLYEALSRDGSPRDSLLDLTDPLGTLHRFARTLSADNNVANAQMRSFVLREFSLPGQFQNYRPEGGQVRLPKIATPTANEVLGLIAKMKANCQCSD